jgi:hypothetical protein
MLIGITKAVEGDETINFTNVENACTSICENECVAGDVKNLVVLDCLDENKFEFDPCTVENKFESDACIAEKNNIFNRCMFF